MKYRIQKQSFFINKATKSLYSISLYYSGANLSALFNHFELFQPYNILIEYYIDVC